MKKFLIPAALLAIVIGIIFIAFPPDKTTQEQPPLPMTTDVPTTVPPDTAIRYPVAEPAPTVEPPPVAIQPEPTQLPSLPNIEQADTVMRELLAQLSGEKTLIELFCQSASQVYPSSATVIDPGAGLYVIAITMSFVFSGGSSLIADYA